jgi:transposase
MESHEMPSKPLHIRQRLAVQFLAAGLTREQVAKRVGVDLTTVSKWRNLPAFEAAINALLSQHEKDSLQTLQALRLKAVERLSELIGSKNHGVALRAIETVLKQATPPPGINHPAANAAWQAMQDELERIAMEASHAA